MTTPRCTTCSQSRAWHVRRSEYLENTIGPEAMLRFEDEHPEEAFPGQLEGEDAPAGWCDEHNRMACPLHDVSPDHIHEPIRWEQRTPVTGVLLGEGEFCRLCEQTLDGEELADADARDRAEMGRRTRLAIEALPALQAELTQLHQEIVGSHPNHPVGSCDRCATDPGINGMADPDWEEPKLEHTVRGKTAGPEGWPYGTNHDPDCPACQDTPYLASPRSDAYWSS